MSRESRQLHDWSSEGIDWRDASMDKALAEDWLRALYLPGMGEGYDVNSRVLEFVRESLDPERGWRLVKYIVELAQNDDELKAVGHELLSPLLDWHADVVGPELSSLVRTDARFRTVMSDVYRHNADINAAIERYHLRA